MTPLAQPIHDDAPGDAPWRDNAFLSFWDPKQDIFGTLHVSTSPNAEGRRARFSLSNGGRMTEIVEELDPGTFESASLGFDLDTGTIMVDSDTVTAAIQTVPRLTLADYNVDPVIPPMGGAPPQHYQSAVAVSGTCRVGDDVLEIEGTGIRDRTWGHRDESVNIVEYAWFFLDFDDFAITAMRFTTADGTDRTDGFVLTEDAATRVRSLSIVRDPAGLAAAVSFDGAEYRSGGRRGGFWVPMGPERAGPAMSAYDEFAPWESAEGHEGFGLAEHGVVRRLF